MTTSVPVSFKMLDDVAGGPRSFRDDLREIFAQAVMRHAALHRHVEVRHVGELIGVVLAAIDRLAEVFADLCRIDIKRRAELDIVDMIATQIDVHQTRNEISVAGIAIIFDALDQ